MAPGFERTNRSTPAALEASRCDGEGDGVTRCYASQVIEITPLSAGTLAALEPDAGGPKGAAPPRRADHAEHPTYSRVRRRRCSRALHRVRRRAGATRRHDR